MRRQTVCGSVGFDPGLNTRSVPPGGAFCGGTNDPRSSWGSSHSLSVVTRFLWLAFCGRSTKTTLDNIESNTGEDGYVETMTRAMLHLLLRHA